MLRQPLDDALDGMPDLEPLPGRALAVGRGSARAGARADLLAVDQASRVPVVRDSHASVVSENWSSGSAT